MQPVYSTAPSLANWAVINRWNWTEHWIGIGLLLFGYRSYANLISQMKSNRNSSKLWLCWYYCMYAPAGLLQKTWDKSLIETTQECDRLFGTDPGSSTLQNSSCTPTYLLSHKPSKKNEQDMRGTASEAINISSWTSSQRWSSSKDLRTSARFGHLIQSRGPARKDGWLRRMSRKKSANFRFISMTWWWWWWWWWWFVYLFIYLFVCKKVSREWI